MNLYTKKQRWKIVLVIAAIVIAAIIIWYAGYIVKNLQKTEFERVNQWGETIRKKADLVKITNESFDALAEEEKKFVETWVNATQEMQKDLNDYSFALSIIQNNDRIPLILTENDNYSSSVNLATKNSDSIANYITKWSAMHPPIVINYADDKYQKIYYNNSADFYRLQLKRDSLIESFNKDLVENTDLVPVVFIDATSKIIIATNLDTTQQKGKEQIASILLDDNPIEIQLDQDQSGLLYYEESPTLKQLRYYPYIMLGIISLFAFIAYFLFSTFRRAEQNQVWVGMAKETAHQLGTPLSSLMAWIELLRSQGADETSLNEMDKDIKRLNTVTDRFSKIGSKSKLQPQKIGEVVRDSVDYMQNRASDKVSFVFTDKSNGAITALNIPLFEWVIENIAKNAIDAMEGKGNLSFSILKETNLVNIEITDTGKGIPYNQLKTIFEPGFTTKKRGWGLGLSLAKRIIEEHHNGKISVKSSSVSQGTTFKIELIIAK